jgi:hypothetical protein
LNEEFSIEEIESAIKANNDHKSPGVDDIKPAFLKKASHVLSLSMNSAITASRQALYPPHGLRQ